MKQAAANKTTTRGGKNQQATLDGWVIGLQLLDTGWRVAVPILLFSYMGVQLDKHHNTRPLFTLIGFFIALSFAITLVYRQVKTAYPDFFEKKKGSGK